MTYYRIVFWPDIQEYMEHPDFEYVKYFDPMKNVWFLPDDWIDENYETWREEQEIIIDNLGCEFG